MSRVAIPALTSIKRLIARLTVGILICFAVGFLEATWKISSHQYIHYGMYNLAFSILRLSLNKWILGFLILFLIGMLLITLFRLAGKWVEENLLAIQIVNHNRVLAFFLSCLMSICFFLGGTLDSNETIASHP